MFWFGRNKNRREGKVVDLVEERTIDASSFNNYVPSIVYGIYRHHSHIRVGNCDLRLGMNDELYYAGNIGYRIEPPYRGNGYAYEACRILLDLAKEKGMQEVIITCSPDNIASLKTLEKLGGTYLETTDVPESHWLYQRGEKVKNIYRWTL